MCNLININSIDELRAAAGAWDDLWRRSDLTLPTVRAEMLAEWLEQFAPRAAFHALVVQQQGQWVAALPLVGRRVARVIGAAGTPSNEWSASGELLLDAGTGGEFALLRLAEAIRNLPYQLLWLDEVMIDASRWQTFGNVLRGAGIACYFRPHYRVARINTNSDWQTARQRWSGSHRQKMSRAARKLAAKGNVQCEIHSRLAAEEVEPLLREAFAVEDRGWKGEAGTSVLRTSGMFEFFLRQARQFARWQQLELCFLRLDGRAIAFTYGYSAKGVFHSCKVSYDPQFAEFAPGQLLWYQIFEQFHGDEDRRAFDCLGVLNRAQQSWRPETYTIGRAMIAPRRLLGRLAINAYRRLKGSQRTSAVPSS